MAVVAAALPVDATEHLLIKCKNFSSSNVQSRSIFRILSTNPTIPYFNQCPLSFNNQAKFKSWDTIISRAKKNDADLVSIEDKGDGTLIFHFSDEGYDSDAASKSKDEFFPPRLPSNFNKKSPISKNTPKKQRNFTTRVSSSTPTYTESDKISTRPPRLLSNFKKKSPILRRQVPLPSEGKKETVEEKMNIDLSHNSTEIVSAKSFTKPTRPISNFRKKSPISILKSNQSLTFRNKISDPGSGSVPNLALEITKPPRLVSTFTKKSPIPNKTKPRTIFSVKSKDQIETISFDLKESNLDLIKENEEDVKRISPKSTRKSKKVTLKSSEPNPLPVSEPNQVVLDSTIGKEVTVSKRQKKTIKPEASKVTKSKSNAQKIEKIPKIEIVKSESSFQSDDGDMQKDDVIDKEEYGLEVEVIHEKLNSVINATRKDENGHFQSDFTVTLDEVTSASKMKVRPRRKKTENGNAVALSPVVFSDDDNASEDLSERDSEIMPHNVNRTLSHNAEAMPTAKLETVSIEETESLNSQQSVDESETVGDQDVMENLLKIKEDRRGQVRQKLKLDLEKSNPAEPPPQDWDLVLLTLGELKDIARTNGLKGYSKLKKAEIIELIKVNAKSK